MTTRYLAADFQSAFLKLLPTGRAWPKDTTSNLSLATAPLMGLLEDNAGRCADLLDNEFITSVTEMIPEWELSLGLPDPCAGAAPTIDARRRQVVARFIGLSGQSLGYLIQFAADLGYSITLTEHAPFRIGFSHAGDPIDGVDSWFILSIHSALGSVDYFRIGVSHVGEPLVDWGNAVLECEMRRVLPAHITPVFSYS